MNLTDETVVVCGGTFDHFHKGHKDFLLAVMSAGTYAIIGVTTDEFVKQLKSGNIESFEVRIKAVKEFFSSQKIDKYEVVGINSLFGPTLDSQRHFSKLVVSEFTKKGAEIINQERKKKSLKELSVVIVPLTKAKDGKPISSSRIRKGEITREGELFIQPIWKKRSRVLPKDLRKLLSQPSGPVIGDLDEWCKSHDPSMVITVGDVVTKTFNDRKFGQLLSVVDFYIRRKKTHTKITDLGFNFTIQTEKIGNPAGTLMPAIFRRMDAFFRRQKKRRYVFIIDGEEDLVVLPCLLAAPLDFIIVYGQPNQGMIAVPVTEETKKIAYKLVSGFREEKV